MKTVLWLLWKDLRRDWKRPWAMLLLAALPLVISVLISSIFGGQGGSGPMPTIHVAVLDADQDLLSGVLRSLPSQGDTAKQLRLHFVQSEAEGLRLVEKNKVSAFLILPSQMTLNLLNGATNAVKLYENPSQQVLPKVVRHGVSLLVLGLSGAAETLGEPLRELRDMLSRHDLPSDTLATQVASTSLQRLRGMRTYLFPPLIQFENVDAADFEPLTNVPVVPP